LKTPEHIAPVWYYTPYYSMLRAVTIEIGPLTAKFLGFMVMAAAIAIWFVLPWLDRSPVKSVRYKGMCSRIAIVVFAAAFIILGVLGVRAPTPERTTLAQICTVLYFLFFIAMPFWTAYEKTKPEPERVTMDGGIGFWKSMGVLLVLALLVTAPLKAVGSEAEFACGEIPCDGIDTDITNLPSLQSGAKTYFNYCMGCHSLKYARYERTANDLGIPLALAEENLIFDGSKIGALMFNAMSVQSGKKWFGIAPPDLTLAARARSPEWLYTYMRNFYADPSRPYGVNNRVFKDVGMPHALLQLQGLQNCEDPCSQFAIADAGSMNPEEYNQAIYDLVNFLTYIAEPMAEERKRIGIYVMLFLCVLLVVTYLLNHEYWKDVH